MSILYNQQIYTTVVSQKEENERYINELYANYSSLTFDEKKQALELIDYIKQINFEYSKYIIVYEHTLQTTKAKNDYTIVFGDTLPKIAQKTMGDYSKWQLIYTHNKLTDVTLIPGDILEIPEDN